MASRFTWEQEHDSVLITIPCSNPLISKPGYFQLQILRTHAKMHLKSPKIFLEFDFKFDLDPRSPLNKATVTPAGLLLIFAKGVPGQHWDDLLCTEKALANQRRQDSLYEQENQLEEQQELADKQKIENDRFSVKEQMRLEKDRRHTIEHRKAQDKATAEAEVYTSLPAAATQPLERHTALPQVRAAHSETLSFTDKPLPHLPARESHNREPPLPRAVKPQSSPAHESHPLWLKDKGDGFFSAQDYESAVNAYNKALQSDNNYVPALLNRSAALLCLYDFNRVLDDLAAVECVSQETQVLAICKVRKGAVLAARGLLAEAIDCFRGALEFCPADQGLLGDISALETRRESDVKKVVADSLFHSGELAGAAEFYKKSLAVDPANEVSLANLAQVAWAQGDLELCKATCDSCLQLLTHNTALKAKVLLRKARATGPAEDALLIVESALSLDPSNPSTLTLHKQLTASVNSKNSAVLKQQADESLRQGHTEEALQLYKDTLALTADKTLKPAVLTNIAACHLLLKQYHDVVATVEKALKCNPAPHLLLRLHWRRAKAYGGLGQLHTAQSDLKKALALDPENPLLLQDFALIQNSINSN